MVASLTADSRRTGRWLLALTIVVYVLTSGGSLTTTDAVVMFDVTENMVARQSVALSGNLLGMESQRGPDGRYYSPFGVGQSLYNVPFYLGGLALTEWTGLRVGKRDTITKGAVALGQTIVAALVVWLTFRFAVVLTGDVAASAIAALTLAFGSVLWPYARFGFNQPLACATLLAAVSQAFMGVRWNERRRLALSGVWLGVSLLTRHEMAIAALPIGLWLLSAGPLPIGDRRHRLLAFAPGLLVGVAGWLAFNAWRFGNPFDTGLLRDPVPALGSSVVAGLSGLLFSPSTSILLYSPVAAVGLVGLALLYRHDRSAAWLLIGTSATFAVFYATLGNWIGGRSYGSRYLLVILPFLVLAWAAWLSRLEPRRRLSAGGVVLVVGIVVQLPGVLVDYAKVSQSAAARTGAFTTAERQWSWYASPLVLNTHALATALPENVGYLVGRRTPPEVRPALGDGDRTFSQQLAFSLDFWWLYLFYLGALSRLAVVAIVAAGLTAAFVCVRRLRASIPAAEA